jgi:hypothetical protein
LQRIKHKTIKEKREGKRDTEFILVPLTNWEYVKSPCTSKGFPLISQDYKCSSSLIRDFSNALQLTRNFSNLRIRMNVYKTLDILSEVFTKHNANA